MTSSGELGDQGPLHMAPTPSSSPSVARGSQEGADQVWTGMGRKGFLQPEEPKPAWKEGSVGQAEER